MRKKRNSISKKWGKIQGINSLDFVYDSPNFTSNIDPNKKPIIIFGIDPTNDVITNELLSKNTAIALKKLSKQAVFIFLLNSRFSIAKDFVNTQLGINNGFLVCHAGSYIYDLSKKRTLFEKVFDDEIKKQIAHKAISDEILILASTQKQDLAYCKNYILRDAFGGYTFLPREYTDDFLTFHSFILYNKFLSFVIFDTTTNRLKKIHSEYLDIASQRGFFVSEICNNMFAISPKNISQYKSICDVLAYLNNSINDNVYYFALNFFNSTLWMRFSKHHFISVECLTDNIKSLKNDNSMVESQIDSSDLIEILNRIIKNEIIAPKAPRISKWVNPTIKRGKNYE